jgi:hypothetical protein
LSTRRQQPYLRGDDHERITNARREAEALFTSKPIREASAPHPQTLDNQSARESRILRALPTAPTRHSEDATSVSAERPPTPTEIPSSQFARIRAWAKYGMTAAQVAGVYGVAVDAIERILRQAS